MRIGLFTDSHYCNKEMLGEGRRPALGYERIENELPKFKDNGVDLVICLGDLVDDCHNEKENIEMVRKISSMIRSFGMDFYCLMGNHDYQNFTREEFNFLTDGAYPPFSVSAKKSVLIFLDCNYEDSGEVYKKGEVDWVNTRLPDDQIELLKKTLSENKDKKAYVFMHQNIDRDVDKCHIVHNAEEIRKILLESGHVEAVIQGHFHSGQRNEIDGIKYITLPAVCGISGDFFEIMDIE